MQRLGPLWYLQQRRHRQSESYAQQGTPLSVAPSNPILTPLPGEIQNAMLSRLGGVFACQRENPPTSGRYGC